MIASLKLSTDPYLRARQRRRLLWTGGALLLLVCFAGSAISYFQAARSEWLAKASTPQLLAAARSEPNSPDVLYVTARRLWERDGRPAEALPLAERAADLAPRKPENHLLLGYLGVVLRKPAEALWHFEEACRLDPDMRFAHSGAAAVYLDGRMPREAIPHYRLAWDPRRHVGPTRVGLIEALYQAGQYQEAEQLCRDTLPHTPPTGAHLYRQFYNVLKAQGRAAEGREAMSSRLRTDPAAALSPFYAELGMIVLDEAANEKDLKEAERLSRFALAKGPTERAAIELRAALLARRGKHAEAVPLFREAMKIDSRPRRTRVLLADSLRSLGRTSEAKAVEPPPGGTMDAARLEQLWAGAPPGVEGRLALANTLESRGDHLAAFRTCWPLMQRRPTDPRVVELANRSLQVLVASSDTR